MTEFLHAFWPACAFAVALMLAIWWLALRVHNLGIVDIAWSYAFAPVAIFFATTTHGNLTRRWLVAGIASLWSLRLGTYLYFRVMGHHPHEDTRYAEMRAKWGKNLKLHVLIFFQLQAVLIALLSIPFLIACLNNRPGISFIEWLGVATWLVAVVGEGTADWQLNKFKTGKDRTAVCQSGLWNYSRHPNYFFEWLVWVGFFVFALGSPFGYATVYCPALMLFFLLRVTGIPLTESLAVRSKGGAYQEYQRTTSKFIPWFKRP